MSIGKIATGITVVLIIGALLFLAFGPLSSTYMGSTSYSSTTTTTSMSSSTTTSSSTADSSSYLSEVTTTSTATTASSPKITKVTTSSTYGPNLTTTTSSSVSGGIGSITVSGTTLNGTSPVNGIRVDLRINGSDIAVGQTPVTFKNLSLGIHYGVVVYWYGNSYIRYINDSNTGMDLQRYDIVTLNQTNPTDQLTAAFEYVPPSQAASLNILAEFPNGTRLGTATVVNGYDLHSPGMWLTLTPPFQNTPYTGTFTGGSILPFILFNNEKYTIQMSSGYYGPWINNLSNTGPTVCIQWSHWKDDGSANMTRTITLTGNITYVTIYEQVDNSLCSSSTYTTNNTAISNMDSSVLCLSILASVACSSWTFDKLRHTSTIVRFRPILKFKIDNLI